MTKLNRAAGQESDVAVERILRVSAAELSKLQMLAMDLQSVLANLTGNAETIDSRDVTALQSLDYITQSLSALSHVMGNAAPQAPADWVIDGTNGVKAVLLSDLKTQFLDTETEEVDFIKPTLVSKGQCDYF